MRFFFLTLFLVFYMAQVRGKTPLTLQLKIFPENAKIFMNGKPEKGQKIENELLFHLEAGSYEIRLESPGYESKILKIKLTRPLFLEEKLEKISTALNLKTIITTGKQPKSAAFTPDGQFFVVPLLEGEGAEVFSIKTLSQTALLKPPAHYSKQKGFVEVAFLKNRKEIWVSQMTAHTVHIFSLTDFSYLASIPVQGNWPKVITVSPDENRVFISNWISEDISEISPSLRKVVRNIKTGGIPRGMAVTPDGKFLYAAIFSSGKIEKIRLSDYKTVKILDFGKGSKRHMVLHPASQKLYISDMGRGSIFVVDLNEDRLLSEIPVDKKLNTIDLSENGLYLFASSRGPNGQKGYLFKGPEFGKAYVICTRQGRVIHWAWGKNQPTGLALSPDGKTLIFTDFLDHQVEVYSVFQAPEGYWQYAFSALPLEVY